jgi:hypothetical protein
MSQAPLPSAPTGAAREPTTAPKRVFSDPAAQQVVAETAKRELARAREATQDLSSRSAGSGSAPTPVSPAAAAEVAAPPPPPPAPDAAAAQKAVAIAAGVSSGGRGRLVADVSSGGLSLWRIVGGTQIERSLDAGVEWRTLAFVPAAPLAAGHAPRANLVWLVGRGGTIYVSTDGVGFERVPFVETVDLVSVTALDDRQATVVGADGRTWQTTDRGLNWTMKR